MQTSDAIDQLCTFLCEFKPNIVLSEKLHGTKRQELFFAKYRDMAIEEANDQLPYAFTECEVPRRSFVQQTKRGTVVSKEGEPFTRLDHIVSADGVPTLVEMRAFPSKSARKAYFQRLTRKEESMSLLFPEFAFLLMLPNEAHIVNALQSPRGHLYAFQERGGKVAVLPYQSHDLQYGRIK